MDINLNELKSQLHDIIIPSVLINIILKYTETSIRIKFSENQILYLDQSEFDKLDCKDIINVDIYGILLLKDPINKFEDSKIQKINGNVLLIGDVNRMFYNATNFNSDLSDWNTEKLKNTSFIFYGVKNFKGKIINIGKHWRIINNV
jgi:surface protein